MSKRTIESDGVEFVGRAEAEVLSLVMCEAFGLVGLPFDADGEVIHIGDKVRHEGDLFYVEEMRLCASDDSASGCMWLISDNAGCLLKGRHLHHTGGSSR